jgi:sRNA-binding protein
MPGGFPEPPPQSQHPDKENKEPEAPKSLRGSLHGLTNKKRHRPSSDEEDAEREVEERASKKRKNNDAAARHTLDSSRPISSTPLGSAKKPRFDRTPSRTPMRAGSKTSAGTPASVKAPNSTMKRAGMSLSRLNMLAQPKNRA